MLDLERLLFKDLVSEIVHCEISKKTQGDEERVLPTSRYAFLCILKPYIHINNTSKSHETSCIYKYSDYALKTSLKRYSSSKHRGTDNKYNIGI